MRSFFNAVLSALLFSTVFSACAQTKKIPAGNKATDMKLANEWTLLGFYNNGVFGYDTSTSATIIISKDEKFFTGNTGCNPMRGEVIKGEESKIKIGPVESLRKHCANDDTEKKFLQSIECTTGYSVKAEILTLYCTDKPVMQLKCTTK